MAYDYQAYWQERVYENHFIEDYQAKLLNKFCVLGNTLEVGCGCGRLSPLFKSYLGIDINPIAIERAKINYADKKFQVGDIVTDEMVPVENIVSCTTLQHIPSEFIEDVADYLKELSDNILIFESNIAGHHAEWCFNHDYEHLFGRPFYIKEIPHTPTRFMVFRGE